MATLTLEQAVSLALRQNGDLRVQSFEPLVAGTFLSRERARFSPELFADVSRRESSSSEIARSTGEQFNSDIEQNRLEAGIRKTFATGTEVALSLAQAGETSNRAPGQDEARVNLSLTQALLQGGGRTVNLVAVQQAQLGVSISQAELHGYTEALVAAVESTYWRYWLAGESIAITRQALEVAEKQLADIRQRIEVGQLARNEESVAQAEVARRRQVLIDARAAHVRSRLELLALIAPGVMNASVIPQTHPEMPEPDSADTAEMRIQLAEASRADLAEARLRMEQRRLGTVMTRDGLLPQLDFFARLAKTGYGSDGGDAWSDIGGDNYDVQVGLSLSRTLGERAEAARDLEARYRHGQAQAAVENLRLQIGNRVLIALNELERAQRQIEASTETRRFQELTVDSEIERFQVGTGTALMVAQAQRDLLASKIEEQRARVQARLALLQLYVAEGSLLSRRGIATAPIEPQ
jgi:outer membrane protein TolC